MYTNVSSNFLTAIESDGRTFHAKIRYSNGTEITDGFTKITTAALSGSGTERMELGGSTTTQIHVEMYSTSVQITCDEFQLFIGLTLANGTIEYVPIGYFTPSKPTTNDGKITFDAYDRMSTVLNVEYVSALSYPARIEDICAEIESMTGIDIINAPSGFSVDRRVDASSGDASTVVYANPFDGYTFKETLGFIAGRVGKFATINRSGQVDFRFYKEVQKTIPASISNSDVLVSNDKFILEYIRCTIDSTQVIQSGSGTTGISLSCYLHNQDTLDAIFTSMKGFSYYPTTVSFMGNILYDLGDIVTVEERNGNTVQVPIMSIAHTYDGGLTTAIGSYGSNSTDDASSTSPTQKAISRIYQKLAVVESLVVSGSITVGDLEKIFTGGVNILNNSKSLEGYSIETSDDVIGDLITRSNNISEEYDDSQSYSVGEYVLKENKLYQCIAGTSGTFKDDAWQEITIGKAFHNIKSEVNAIKEEIETTNINLTNIENSLSSLVQVKRVTLSSVSLPKKDAGHATASASIPTISGMTPLFAVSENSGNRDWAIFSRVYISGSTVYGELLNLYAASITVTPEVKVIYSKS